MSEKSPVFRVKDILGEIEVYESAVVLSPKSGKRGKTIEFSSIERIKFKESGRLNGYILFILVDEKEFQFDKGVTAITKDVNAFAFSGGHVNLAARRIKEYIENRLRDPIPPPEVAAATDSKGCVKCGHIRQPTGSAPDFECPQCGEIYSKVEGALAASTMDETKHQAPQTTRPQRQARTILHSLGPMSGSLYEHTDSGKVAYRRFLNFVPSFMVTINDVTGVSGQMHGVWVRLKIHGLGSILAEADVAHGEMEKIGEWFERRKQSRMLSPSGTNDGGKLPMEPETKVVTLAEQLRQLSELHAAGVINSEEFTAAKRKLIEN